MTLRTHTTFWHKGCLLVKLSKSQTAHVRLFEFVTLSNVPLIGKGPERPKNLIRTLSKSPIVLIRYAIKKEQRPAIENNRAKI